MQTGITRSRTAPALAGLLAVFSTGCKTLPQPAVETLAVQRPISRVLNSSDLPVDQLGEPVETTLAFAELIAARQNTQPITPMLDCTESTATRTNPLDTLSHPQGQPVVQNPGRVTIKSAAGWSSEQFVQEFGRGVNPVNHR